MKRYIGKLLFFTVTALVVLNGCKRSYELEPLERLSEDYVWDTKDSLGTNAEKFLVNIYSNLPSGFNRVSNDYLDAATDDAVSSAINLVPVTNVQLGGGYDIFDNFDGTWAANYKAIRAANIFLNNIEKVPVKGTIPTGVPLRKAWRAEARFLRAFFYFELVKRYAGVPLVGNSVKDITSEDVLIPRNTFSDCVEYIVGECDKAADSLRTDPVDDGNFGRITKGAALALKARVLLYAASPLYNHNGDVGLPNGAAAQKGLSGYTDYSKDRWKRASDAAKALVTYGRFSLEAKFKDAFIKQNSPEVILSRNGGAGSSIEVTNGPIGLGNPTGNGRTSPTQEFVDAFLTINGKPISEDPISITNPTGYDVNNPYLNRDKRFDASIFYNGKQWLNTQVQTFEGGVSKPGTGVQQTKTGYYLRKFMGDYETTGNYGSTYHNFNYFRYAEVLLNFAEAENEYLDAPSAEVYNTIVQIRKRAEIIQNSTPATTYGYGLKNNMTKDEMRTVIRNERRIELAFEEHHFWDIRRWLTAKQVLTGTLHGKKILRANSGLVTYETKDVQQVSFGNANRYLFPIPNSEMIRNGNLVQNPGW